MKGHRTKAAIFVIKLLLCVLVFLQITPLANAQVASNINQSTIDNALPLNSTDALDAFLSSDATNSSNIEAFYEKKQASLGETLENESSIEQAVIHEQSEQGNGVLEIEVATVREKTPRQISILPSRVEIWTQDRMLASLKNGEEGVENAFHRRNFKFAPITLPVGYYFVTIRGFAEGFVSREQKWKGKVVQVGIHKDKTTKIREKLSMFVW